MRKLTLIASAAALLALPAAPASAAEIPEVPEINCGIVSCTYVLEQRVETVRECVDGAVAATQQIIQGITPEMQECSIA